MLEYFISGISIIITAFAGSYYTNKSVKSEWYKNKRPTITPPNYIFPIVWTTIYILLFFAFADVIQKHDYITIGIFIINLLLNILWCYLYFGIHKPYYALISLIILIITNIIIMYRAWTMNRDIYLCLLFIPYTLWLLFAGVLNFLSI